MARYFEIEEALERVAKVVTALSQQCPDCNGTGLQPHWPGQDGKKSRGPFPGKVVAWGGRAVSVELADGSGYTASSLSDAPLTVNECYTCWGLGCDREPLQGVTAKGHYGQWLTTLEVDLAHMVMHGSDNGLRSILTGRHIYVDGAWKDTMSDIRKAAMVWLCQRHEVGPNQPPGAAGRVVPLQHSSIVGLAREF